MNLQSEAFKIGYESNKNNGPVIFAHNKQAMSLINGREIGENKSIMIAFMNGVEKYNDEVMAKLMSEE